MSPNMHMTASPVSYTPTSDAMDRHDYGVSKNRKTASTGGGRAWSEDEEVYLLQTRLQKMPYKHIAAHLKKTELACRLHYHQLSHGSNRRKRTTSVGSSSSSTGGHSPLLPACIPSPIREHVGASSLSRSVSPSGSTTSYGPISPNHGVQLPSLMNGANSNISPRLPAILPKPLSAGGYSSEPHHSRSAASSAFRRPSSILPARQSSMHHSHLPGPLRLDCSAATTLPPPIHSALTSAGGYPPHSAGALPQGHVVDMSRLHSAYAAHRVTFWAAVAAEYGPNSPTPYALEQAWRDGRMGGAIAPMTPLGSPDESMYGSTPTVKQDRTRISAILGIDANPRSPKERELVRRLEERCSVGAVGA